MPLGGKDSAHCIGERRICRKNHGAGHCLGVDEVGLDKVGIDDVGRYR